MIQNIMSSIFMGIRTIIYKKKNNKVAAPVIYAKNANINIFYNEQYKYLIISYIMTRK